MYKLKRGDNVQVIKGKDKGKKGNILRVLFTEKRAIIEGINMVKKHKRRTRDDQKGGIVSVERPISIANIMLVCKQCNRPVRVGFSVAKDGAKSRFCKTCKETI
jgi:large subunit ribosomal protein L24